jgi:hypothetical protein
LLLYKWGKENISNLSEMQRKCHSVSHILKLYMNALFWLIQHLSHWLIIQQFPPSFDIWIALIETFLLKLQFQPSSFCGLKNTGGLCITYWEPLMYTKQDINVVNQQQGNRGNLF